MSQTGDAAEQIVNMATNVTVKGIEVATNLAGKGALSLAAFLIAALKDQKRTKGKARMKAFNGKPTKVFVIKASELKRFAEEARKYGVLYAAVVNRKQPDGLCDIVVNANDAAKVNRIAERFALSTVDVEKIREDIKKVREAKAKQPNNEKERTAPPSEKAAHTVDEHTLDELLNGPKKTEHKQPADFSNPTKAGTERSNPSAPFSGNRGDIAEA
jgi:ribosomal protein S2